jgi:serine/threonine protein kinase/formylglycine-generating enzyme required for sulfatase activity
MVHEYRLLRQIGSGGMGEIYKAHDTFLDRPVAVKFVHTLHTAPDARQRFLIEARAAARIQHPNVVSVYRVGEIGDRLFIVSELVRGTSLDRLAKPLPWQRVSKLALGIARGLAAAHREGVLHRDIKPSNVILASDDQVKLLDFGLAEIEETAARGGAAAEGGSGVFGAGALPSLEPTMPVAQALQAASVAAGHGHGAVRSAAAAAGTPAPPGPEARGEPEDDVYRASDSLEFLAQFPARSGQRGDDVPWGTPRYLAPELWRGEAATRRTDIYAFGVLLYELCTGAPPHAEADIVVLSVLVSEEPPRPLAELVPDIDPRFAALVDRCLASDPAARFDSADALCDELERLARSWDNRTSAEIRAEPDVPEGNPYRGLLTFEAEHRALFFGRRAEIGVLVERLRTEPFLLVAGDSGVGKSSLCRAGLLPLVADGALGPSRRWEIVRAIPGPRPVTALAEALAPALGEQPAVIAATLRTQPTVFDHFVRRHLPEGRGLFLFVDQLEELVTMAGAAEAALVGKALGSLAVRSADLRLLVTARSDFLSRLAGLMDEIARALYFLQPMSIANIRDAIVGPARVKGVSFESDALVDDLATSAARAEGGLPLLQFTLAELWDARPANGTVLTAAALEDIGGVGGSLSRHADRVLLALTVAQRDAARRLLTSLVTAEGTRARRSEAELDASAPDRRVALDALIRGRLVVAHASDPGAVYELAHDTLVAGWGTLRRWIDEEIEGREIKLRLAASAAEWERLGRTREVLWGGRQLAEARRLRPEALGDRELAFLDASRRARTRARFLRRAGVVAIVVAVALAYGSVQLAATRTVEQRVRAQMRSASAVHGAARQKRVELDRLRAESLAAFDARRLADGEGAWARALTTATELDALFLEASRILEGAALLGGKEHDVHRMLGDVLYERALAAEVAGKIALRDELVQRMEMYDPGGVHTRQWRAPGRLGIASTPSGARVTLARYEDAAGRKLVLGEPRDLGTTPIADLELPPGSYMLVLSAPGRADVHYPLVLGRDERLDVAVPLLEPGEIPDGFVYVPPGRFLFGSGDSEEMRQKFLGTVPIHPVAIDGYFIARHETTYGDWIEYLRALPPAERRQRQIRAASGVLHGSVELIELPDGVWQLTLQPTSQTFVMREGENLVYPGRARNATQDWRNLPVGGITFPEAEAYAAWLDATGRVPGARMCTDREWERAARGADDRLFPHGNALDASDANIDGAYPEGPSQGPDAVGSFPASRSPFGIDDMTGNVFEWTRSSLVNDEVLAQGGAYFFDSIQARSNNRGVLAPDTRGAVIGVRLCASVQPAGKASH